MKLFLLLFFVNCFNVFASEDKIIIIGAGPSGIATASKLLENGIDNILILEAESRIGGRVHTVVFDGRKIDMGGEWCHGQKDNVVYETLKKLNLLDLLHHDDLSLQFYMSSRINISNEFSTELFGIFEEIIYNDYAGTKDSLGPIIKQKYIETISKKYENNSEKLYIARLALENLRHAFLSLEGSLSWDDVSTDSEYIECEGDQQLAWKNGYGQFLDILTKKYPNPKDQLPIDNKMHYNKEVIEITYGEKDPPIKILCSDNSSYTAKHVIITTSVGVLKEKAEHLFKPKLSESKLKAIRNIGFGAVMKVFITFDTKWWGNLTDFFLVWTEEDRTSARSKFPHGPTNQKGESWIVEHYAMLSISNSNILEIWFTGDMVPIIETMDENILKNGIHFTLNLFLGHLYRIPEPQKLLRASNISGERSPFDGSCCGSGYHTVDSTPLGSPEESEIPKYRVVMLGDAGVGKTALVSQFMTSEYMNTYDASLDDEFGERTVSILLDGEESEMIFIDHPSSEMSVENSLSTYEPHACIMVYSVVSRSSFQAAEDTLNYLWRESYTQEKSVIVVGNKADLARARVISANEGKALAVARDCKFIETSSGIQHNVDELLVGILKQIRLRESRDKKKSTLKKDNNKLHSSKTSLSLNIAREILQKICLNDISKSKSCENLHVL